MPAPSFLGRLQDHGATGSQRGAQLARRIAQRVVPRCEGGHRPHRLLHHGHAHAGDPLWQHPAIGAPALFGIPVEDLRRRGKFRTGFRKCLALLQRRDAGDGIAAFALLFVVWGVVRFLVSIIRSFNT